MARISFDIGGTFTDFALARDGHGELVFHKVPTTPEDPAVGVMRGLQELAQRAGLAAREVTELLHATTVATNAVLERKGARTAVITTEGFRDVLLIGREKRYDVFDLYMRKPEALVRRRDIFEVAERLNAAGEVVAPFDRTSAAAVARQLAEKGYESVAIGFLHSYVNPAHERAMAEEVRRHAPRCAVTLSSDVSPRYREYERLSTAVANAYVKPTVARYLDGIQKSLAERGYRAALSIMQSNGGLVTPEFAREYPVRIIESGPAAGVLMCARIGRELGLQHVLTFDMGGTTAKLGAIDGGQPAITSTFEVDMVRFIRGSGLPLNISSIELLEIGAGGGSIASVEMGLIRVGPSSAGAVPGPMCYGKGGTDPTVTDSNVVLGYIDPNNFNGGAIRLDGGLAKAGVEEKIAGPLGLSVERAAWGIHAMVNSDMERALRLVSIERGRDPRQYALVAFGGAGPIHAARLARQVGIRKVIVPYGAGVGSAIGLLQAKQKVDAGVTRVIELADGAVGKIRDVFAELRRRIEAHLATFDVASDRLVWSRAAHMRYRGQGYDLRVELPDEGAAGGDEVAAMVSLFHEAYQRNYGYREHGVPIEATEWYLSAEWTPKGPEAATVSSRAGGTSVRRRRAAYFPEAGGYVEVDVFDRASMRAGESISGPAIIEEREATTVILPGDRGRIEPGGHLIIDIGTEGRL
ncbi:MAG TPA: hydantoinase/oxoprolinase family protein [Thermodesulfobacteriota bacterium]